MFIKIFMYMNYFFSAEQIPRFVFGLLWQCFHGLYWISFNFFSCLLNSRSIIFLILELRREKFLGLNQSPAHDANHLAGKNFQSQIKQVAHGTHTGALESFHSSILAYTSKRVDFDPASYSGRVALAIMDHNENVGRSLKTGKTLFP